MGRERERERRVGGAAVFFQFIMYQLLFVCSVVKTCKYPVFLCFTCFYVGSNILLKRNLFFTFFNI